MVVKRRCLLIAVYLIISLTLAAFLLFSRLLTSASSQEAPLDSMFCFQQVANMMVRMKREFTGSQNSVFPVFDNLLLLDRNVDLLTPLATQLTYEGLIDEIYGIQNSK